MMSPPQFDSPPPSSIAHDFPWEVLLAVCEQADEATLVQLCLVSFGMLGFAGPILYRHVAISTPERLHGCFIEPSIIPAASRLRPAIGLSHLRFLDIDYRNFDVETSESFLPASVWLAANTRFPLVVRLHEAAVQLGAPLEAAIHSISNWVRKILLQKTKKYGTTAHFSARDEGTFELEFATLYGPALDIVRMRRLDLDGAARVLPRFLNRDRPVKLDVVVTMDVRRVVLDPLHPAAMGHIRTIAAELATNRKLHTPEVTAEVVFRVASNEVAKVVEDVLAASRSTHPTHRCRIDMS